MPRQLVNRCNDLKLDEYEKYNRNIAYVGNCLHFCGATLLYKHMVCGFFMSANKLLPKI